MKKVFSKVMKSLLIIVVVISLSILCFQHSTIAAEAEDLSQEGIGYYKKGALDTAIITLKQAIELDPNIVESHYYLGLAYEAKEMYEDAIKAYKKVREISNTRDEITEGANKHLVDIYRRKGMWDEMINFLKQTPPYPEELPPSQIVNIHLGLGKCYMMKKMYVDSINEFEKAIQIQPDLIPDTYFFLGCNYNYLFDKEKAIQNLKKYLELAPDGMYANGAKEMIGQLTKEKE